jgi:SAM-dependent methyltransferase
MAIAPEEVFYSRHQLSSPSFPSSDTYLQFKPGTRYSIVRESIEKNTAAPRNLIAELGCSDGSRLIYTKELFGFSRAIGLDLLFSMDRPYVRDGLSFFSANLNNSWPLQDNSCDVLIAMMLLEHLFDPLMSFQEIKRVLSPLGSAYINLPLITSAKNRIRLLFGAMPITSVPYSRWFKEAHWDGFHLHNYTIRSIRDLAAFSGLTIKKMTGVGRFHRIKTLAPSLLCNEISFELRHIS